MAELLNFNNYYTEIFSFDARTDIKKIFLGDATQRSCRFCSKTTPEVTFNTKAHAIPELFNNKEIISNYECDSCNKKFSETIENQLGIMLTPYRAIRQLKKKGGGKVQLSKSTKIQLENGTFIITMPFMDYINSNPEIKTGIDKKGDYFLQINSPVEYTPIECYLAYVKMAISVAPDIEIPYLKWSIDWLKNEPHTSSFEELLVIEQVVKTEFSSLYTKLYKLIPSCPYNVPTYAFVIAYYDFMITIYLPAFGESFDNKLLREIPWLPNMHLGAGNFRTHKFVDMNNVEKISVSLPYGYSGNRITRTIKINMGLFLSYIEWSNEFESLEILKLAYS